MATKKALEPKIALEVVGRNLDRILELCDDYDGMAEDTLNKVQQLAMVARNAASDGLRYRDRSISLGKGLKVATT